MARPHPIPAHPPVIPPIPLPDGRLCAVHLRISPRAKRVALRLHPACDYVELVVPAGASLDHATGFLASRQDWIATQINRMPLRVPFEAGAVIPVLGQDRILKPMGPGRGRIAPFTVTSTHIEVTGPLDHLARRTRQGLAKSAQSMLAEKCAQLAKNIARPVGLVRVGDARSRWGSCAATGNIKFSWRLIFAPEPVMDYVVAHEVAHLVELNHGPRFWRLVAALHPSFDRDRLWLQHHGARLLRYG